MASRFESAAAMYSRGEGIPVEGKAKIATLDHLKAICSGRIDPVTMADRIAAAAAQTHRTPSEAQVKAGNYPKGRTYWHGLEISIETPKGAKRHGRDIAMPCHYGFFRRTLGADGDQLDVFIGSHPESELVYVIDQTGKDGRWDEHKCLIGMRNESEAKAAYLASYPSGWRCGPITSMTIGQFINWVRSGNPRKPIAGQVSRYQRAEQMHAAHKYAFTEQEHPRDEGGKFSEKKGAYWRVHSGPFTEKDLHGNHKSKVWLDQDDENTRNGLSVAETLDDLASYFAGHKKGGSSAGRGATFGGTHLAQVEGTPSEDTPYEEEDKERLIHPKRILSSTPIEETPFLDMVRKKMNERFGGDFGDHEYEFNGNGFDRIQRGTHGWTPEERDAVESSSMTPDELKEVLSTGPSHQYWDSVEQMENLYPDELELIKKRFGQQASKYSREGTPMTRYEQAAMLYAAKHKPAKDQGEFRWITIGSHGEGEGGGVHVKIDGKGDIVAGPKGIADKGVKNLSDFGKKDDKSSKHSITNKDDKPKDLDTPKTVTPIGRFVAKGSEIYDDKGVRHAAFRNEEKAKSAAEEWNKSGKPGERKSEESNPETLEDTNEPKRVMKPVTFKHALTGSPARDWTVKSHTEYKGYKIVNPHAGSYVILDSNGNKVSEMAGPNGARDYIDKIASKPEETKSSEPSKPSRFEEAAAKHEQQKSTSKIPESKPVDIPHADAEEMEKRYEPIGGGKIPFKTKNLSIDILDSLPKQQRDAIIDFSRANGMELKKVPLSQIKPSQEGEDRLNDSSKESARTLKTGDLSQIAKADVAPIKLDDKGNIVDGNHRFTAAQMNGQDDIYAFVPQKKAEETPKPAEQPKGPELQIGLFSQSELGKAPQLFDTGKEFVKPKKGNPSPVKEEPSMLEKIGDEQKARSEASKPLMGQKELGDQAARSLLPDSAKIGMAPAAVKRAEDYLASLGNPPPPPKPGMTRLYRGHIHGTAAHPEAFFADDRGLAGVVIPFARAKGRGLYYVDVPDAIAKKGELGGAVTEGEFQIPPEYSAKMKQWGESTEPSKHSRFASAEAKYSMTHGLTGSMGEFEPDRYAENKRPIPVPKSRESHKPEKTPPIAKKQTGWVTLGGSHVHIGDDGKILAGCPGLKGEHVEDLDDNRHEREVRQDHAIARGLTGKDVSSAEAKRLSTINRMREHESAKEASKTSGHKTSEILRVLPEAHELHNQDAALFKPALTRLTAMTKATPAAMRDWENKKGLDHSTWPNFDHWARVVAAEHPELGMDKEDHETPARLWEMLRTGGKGPNAVETHDPQVAKTAAEMLGSRKSKQPEYVPDTDYFSRSRFEMAAMRYSAAEVVDFQRKYAAHDVSDEKRDEKGQWTRGDHVLKAMSHVEPRADSGALVNPHKVREHLGWQKPEFDAIVKQLAEEGKISGHAHDFPSSLSAEEREKMVNVDGRHWVGIAKRPQATTVSKPAIDSFWDRAMAGAKPKSDQKPEELKQKPSKKPEVATTKSTGKAAAKATQFDDKSAEKHVLNAIKRVNPAVENGDIAHSADVLKHLEKLGIGRNQASRVLLNLAKQRKIILSKFSPALVKGLGTGPLQKPREELIEGPKDEEHPHGQFFNTVGLWKDDYSRFKRAADRVGNLSRPR